jgi:general secretion pathway protein J
VIESRVHFRNAGFTLVEVLVASTLGAFIALVAVSALRAITTSAKMLDTNLEVAAEVRFASNMVQTDLVNLYRDKDQKNTRLIGMAGESGDETTSYLVLYTVGRTKARIDKPEGDVYEVEYYLARDQQVENEQGQTSVLMRRLWPYPDKEQVKPGGVLTVIAENIDVFQVRYFDGQDWANEWPEEMETLPQLVEVNIVARPPGGGDMVTESITVNLVRSVGTLAGAIGTGKQTETSGQGSGPSGNEGTLNR